MKNIVNWKLIEDNYFFQLNIYKVIYTQSSDNENNNGDKKYNNLSISNLEYLSSLKFLYVPNQLSESMGQEWKDINNGTTQFQNKTQELQTIQNSGFLKNIQKDMYTQFFYPKVNKGFKPRSNQTIDIILFTIDNSDKDVMQPIRIQQSLISPTQQGTINNLLGRFAQIDQVKPSELVFSANLMNLILFPYQGLSDVKVSYNTSQMIQNQNNLYRPQSQTLSFTLLDILPIFKVMTDDDYDNLRDISSLDSLKTNFNTNFQYQSLQEYENYPNY